MTIKKKISDSNLKYRWDFKLIYKLYMSIMDILQWEKLDQSLTIYLFTTDFW